MSIITEINNITTWPMPTESKNNENIVQKQTRLTENRGLDRWTVRFDNNKLSPGSYAAKKKKIITKFDKKKIYIDRFRSG